jgi:hypothetical protein
MPARILEVVISAAYRTVLSFKHRPIVAHRGHHPDGAYRNWFLALSNSRPRCVNHSLARHREVMAFPHTAVRTANRTLAADALSIRVGFLEQQLAPPVDK